MIDDDLLEEFRLSDHGWEARNKVYTMMEIRHAPIDTGAIKSVLDAVGGEGPNWRDNSPSIISRLGKLEQLVNSILHLE